MKTETYLSYIVQRGLSFLYWTGRRWTIHIHDAKQYGIRADAEKAAAKAGIDWARIKECRLTIGVGDTAEPDAVAELSGIIEQCQRRFEASAAA